METKTITLTWRAAPMLPSLNIDSPGVYAFVLQHLIVEYHGQKRQHSIYQVGQSNSSIKCRWHDHLKYCLEDGTYWYPKSQEDFFTNPVAVLNNAQTEYLHYKDSNNNQEVGTQEDCKKTYKALFEHTWCCWAEIDAEGDKKLIKDIEYVLQESVKKFIGITAEGEIGDAKNRTKPSQALEITNTFANNKAKDILQDTLPAICHYPPKIK